ncbi:alpha/beta-hydrolase [Lentinus tigrinus ALCF2SS1-6]|uniref:Alpha/beta-hydrolase n=1 Tax=Lentinus tigrinus ALCF2SS1-6 TaxID=1328759 RepID=A0A5C2RTG0_9APHY|nr:alpha/beta-hydrolase [Lentinus tigrinus ALCF2SS1-6]
MSTILAGPCGDCCSRTVQHSGVARGTIEVIANLQTYVARPHPNLEDTQLRKLKVILFFADVFGALYINSKLAMDYWADNGYLVLGVDYFEGDSRAIHEGKPGWNVDEWVQPYRASAAKITSPWIEAVRDRYGYCFGAPFVMDLLATDWVTAGAFAHPAFLDENHFRNLKQDDFTFPHAARRRAEDILVEQHATHTVQIFSGARHGYATRADPELRTERWAKEETARATLNWFNERSQR